MICQKFQRRILPKTLIEFLAMILCFGASGLSLGQESATSATEITTIADWPCDEWTRRRALGERTDAPQMWLVGYLTGMASALRLDVLAITDATNAFQWMDTWCLENRGDYLSRGGHRYFKELIERLPRGPALTL